MASDAADENATPPESATQGLTLLDVLEKRFPESTRTTLRGMIADKRVLIDGQIARTLKQPIAANASVEVIGRIAARQRVVPNLPFKVVHEDADLLVIDKPAGLITSSGERDQRATAISILTDHYAQIDPRVEVGLVHRLDKDASGLLVFSKNARAFEALVAQFADRSAGRAYRAITRGIPSAPEGKIESKLVELADGTVRSTTHAHYGDPAVTHYKTIETRGQHAMLDVRLETGRKHQIRAHLAERKCPIAGDPLYNPHANAAPRLMLIAVELTVHHPRADRPMTWTIDLPREVREWWDDPKRMKSR